MISEGTAFFGEEEARHCLQVLRKSMGDSIFFTDGKGSLCEGTITVTGRRAFQARVDKARLVERPRPYRLHIGIVPTKNMDRMEWFAEKATELGVDEITLLTSANSERRTVRADRLEKIVLSAMKQSLQAWMPSIHPMKDLSLFIKENATAENSMRFIGHCREQGMPHLARTVKPGADVTMLIGPEGDFTAGEVELAEAQGFIPVGLGDIRLRTETAAMAVCQILQIVNLP
jgi:16S rRNA (uracil1498-N3)-methyltransferase